MQDLSSEDKKKYHPKTIKKQPKNYPRIVFGHKRRISPYRVSEIHVNLQHRK